MAKVSTIPSSSKFQSTHPRGVRHQFFDNRREIFRFQSTHPRGVRRAKRHPMARCGCVSIHAPAWGATHFLPELVDMCHVSIHAPAWGATIAMAVMMYMFDVFQSTHPRGVRRLRLCAGRGRDRVSIHAPAWGATLYGSKTPCALNLFQSTHPRGVRRLFCLQQGGQSRFQSTHPRGVRRATRRSRWCWRASFNPRTRVGCDGVGGLRIDRDLGFNPRTRVGCDGAMRTNRYRRFFVSIHAPAWGATCSPNILTNISQVSIHAPAWGATRYTRKDITVTMVSIHAPAWGATSGFRRATG